MNPAPHWRNVFIALVLALTIGSAGQTPLTQAAPTGDENISIGLYADQVKGQHTICVGDEVVIRVKVLKRYGLGAEYTLGRLIGVEVTAFVDGSGVGKISPAKNTTRMDSDPMGVAYFTFSAEKPGEATVGFLGKLNTRVIFGIALSYDTVTDYVSLTVEECTYTVTTSTHWPAMYGTPTIVAIISNAGMTEVGDGLYKGTAGVEWIVSGIPTEGNVFSKSTTAYGQAELSGQVSGPDLIIVDVDFLPVDISIAWNFGPMIPYQFIADPLQFSVPASGGSFFRDHVLLVSGGGGTAQFSDSTIIILSRAVGQ